MKNIELLENRALRRFLRPNREEVAGEWRKLRKKELHNLLIARYY
jgi:hypothetical protein